MIRVLVLTISDRASAGIYEDRSGPAITEILRRELQNCDITNIVIPDEQEQIIAMFSQYRDADCIITTGGTGLSARDVTPQTTESYCDYLVPGIAEYLRMKSLQETKSAMLSRGVAGVRGKTLIINFPGSVRGATFCAEQIAPILPHAIDMMAGKGHG